MMVSVNIGIRNSADGQICTTDLRKTPWEVDETPGYGPGSSMWDSAPPATPTQGVIPEWYRTATSEQLHERIMEAKTKLDDRLVILGHFYQRDEVIQYADYVGDSFQLAQAARNNPLADHIVFCGVHFMAETADIISADYQKVVLPNLAAGCSMADMADIGSVEEAWEQLMDVYGGETTPVIPVTYMNSSAALKAFCGANGGVVCTSSNAERVLEWAFQQGKRVLFFPDQHLGRNTAKKLGIPLERMVMWNPKKPYGGNTDTELAEAEVILWQGFCSVHKRFTVQQIQKAREKYAGQNLRVIVHPECTMEVVDAADENGSTDYIMKAVAAATEPTVFAVGTEVNMVNRLAAEYPQHTIFCLDPVICPCSTMYRIHPSYLAWVLDNIMEGITVNQIVVPEEVQNYAHVALNRMLELTPR